MDSLQRPPQRFAAHIDAEGGLHLDLGGRLRRLLQQGRSELALVSRLQRELPQFIDQQVLARLFQALLRTGPGLLHGMEGVAGGFVILALQQQGAPGHADGQQFAQVFITAAGQFRLPAQVGTPGGPAVDGQQDRFQVVGPHLRRQVHAPHHPAFGLARAGRQRADAIGDVRQPHQQADAVVVLQRLAPERIQAQAALGLPVGLVLVEIGGTGLADLVRDGLAPGEPGMTLRIVVQHVDEQRQARRRIGRVQHPEAVVNVETALLGLDGLGQCVLQVGLGHPALVPGLLQLFLGREYLDSAQQGHARRHLAQRHADPRPVRIDGDGAVQWPGRGDGSAGILAGLLQALFQLGAPGGGRGGQRLGVLVEWIVHALLR